MSASEYEISFWLERLSANAPAEEQTQAVAWFRQQGPQATLALVAAGHAPSRKDRWEGVVRVLANWLDRDDVRARLLGWIDDPNWPGAGLAWEHLVACGRPVLPHLERALARAEANQDEDWQERLGELRDEILETVPDRLDADRSGDGSPPPPLLHDRPASGYIRVYRSS